MEEFQQLPDGPKMLVGDLNAYLCDLPSIASCVDAGTMIDLGASHVFDSPPSLPTCFPPNHLHPTRRDFVL
eukprot:6929546-Karenia_brevis.AAC.1